MKNQYSYKHNPLVKKIFFAMLAPTILMNLTTAIGSMADTVIIGQYLDDQSLSVVTFALPVFMAINILSALFAVGGCITMSIDAGKGQKENANKAFSIAMELMVFAGILMLLAGVFFSSTITGWLGAESDVFNLVETYVRIILIGSPFFILSTGLAFFVRNDGRPTLSMVGMFSSILSDVILNVVFVGYLDMGVAGAAYSTVIGNILCILILLTHFFSRKNTLLFRPALDGTAIRIFKNGGSSALTFVYQFITILIMNHLLAALAGTEGIVVYTVVFNLTTVSLSVFEGISQTIQPMVGTYFGEKSYQNVKETVRLAFLAVFLICGTVTLLLELFPQVVPVIFGIDAPQIIEQSKFAVRIYATGMIVTTANVVIGYYLQSIEQSLMAAVLISLRCLVLFLVAIFTLGYLFKLNGIWFAYVVTETVSFVIALLMLKIKQRKLKTVTMLLLDKAVATSITTYTCNLHKDAFDEFKQAVVSRLADKKTVTEPLARIACEHLDWLEKQGSSQQGGLIEVEFNPQEGKVIIRDTFKINNPNIADYNLNQASAYSPVLGFNRLCLEGD